MNLKSSEPYFSQTSVRQINKTKAETLNSVYYKYWHLCFLGIRLSCCSFSPSLVLGWRGLVLLKLREGSVNMGEAEKGESEPVTPISDIAEEV